MTTERQDKSERTGLLSPVTAVGPNRVGARGRELQKDTWRLGAPRSSSWQIVPRQCVRCVRSVTLRPRVNVPALVVELYDGSRY
jgi:hypothetical protein